MALPGGRSIYTGALVRVGTSRTDIADGCGGRRGETIDASCGWGVEDETIGQEYDSDWNHVGTVLAFSC